MEARTVTAQVGNQTITVETGSLAKQADGSVVLRAGDSVVLVTARYFDAELWTQGEDFEGLPKVHYRAGRKRTRSGRAS